MMMTVMTEACVCVRVVGGLGSAAGCQEASQEKVSSTVHWPKMATHVVLGECALLCLCTMHWVKTYTCDLGLFLLSRPTQALYFAFVFFHFSALYTFSLLFLLLVVVSDALVLLWAGLGARHGTAAGLYYRRLIEWWLISDIGVRRWRVCVISRLTVQSM